MIGEFGGKSPQIESSAYIAETAVVVGDVQIGAESSIWFGAIVRADEGAIQIGCRTNIQDNATVHDLVSIGSGVTIGHHAVVHGCTIEDDVLIGMGAIVLDGAVIGAGSIVAAGSVVKAGTVVPPRTMVAGNPAVYKKDVAEAVLRYNQDHALHYVRLAYDYRLSRDQ